MPEQEPLKSAFWDTYPAEPTPAPSAPGALAEQAGLTTSVQLTDDEAMVVFALRLMQRAAIGGITPLERATLSGAAEILRQLSDHCSMLIADGAAGHLKQEKSSDETGLQGGPPSTPSEETPRRRRPSRARKESNGT